MIPEKPQPGNTVVGFRLGPDGPLLKTKISRILLAQEQIDGQK